MDLFDIEEVDGEIVDRSTSSLISGGSSDQSNIQPDSDSAILALELVSGAAAAIRLLEEESAQAVARAHEVASSIVKKLDDAEARLEKANEARQEAEATAAQWSAVAAKLTSELEQMQKQYVLKAEQLSAAEERIRNAEKGLGEANAAIEKIVEAIKTQLPTGNG